MKSHKSIYSCRKKPLFSFDLLMFINASQFFKRALFFLTETEIIACITQESGLTSNGRNTFLFLEKNVFLMAFLCENHDQIKVSDGLVRVEQFKKGEFREAIAITTGFLFSVNPE